MGTMVGVQGEDFLLNGELTYPGCWRGSTRVEGLLLNSRMIQAVFDDENPDTRPLWAYPDTGQWDADRNTEEFCAALPHYAACGLRAVTVGLQGGGSIYEPSVYSHYLATAFLPDGTLKQAWMDRLRRVLRAAEAAGIVVIVSLFYWRQERFNGDEAIFRATDLAWDWLLHDGASNVILEIKNEIRPGSGLLHADGVGKLLARCRERRGAAAGPLLSTSTFPKVHLMAGTWQDEVDVWMPHGNDSTANALSTEISEIRALPSHRDRPRPILINEDSIHLENLDAAIEAGASWGYYDQGYGSGAVNGRFDWTRQPRESEVEHLSGFQTLPINWGINTAHKRAFFTRVAEWTGGQAPA